MVSISRLPDARTRSGSLVTAWLVPCMACGRSRVIRRKQHAERLRYTPCKKCAVPQSHPQEEFLGIRASFFRKFEIGARNRGIGWEINIAYAAEIKTRQCGKCALTGMALVFGGAFQDITASLDRIDSALGYVPGNVQWVHKAINMMKGTLPQSEFVDWCRAVADKVKW